MTHSRTQVFSVAASPNPFCRVLLDRFKVKKDMRLRELKDGLAPQCCAECPGWMRLTMVIPPLLGLGPRADSVTGCLRDSLLTASVTEESASAHHGAVLCHRGHEIQGAGLAPKVLLVQWRRPP